jgi:hypothetical protein
MPTKRFVRKSVTTLAIATVLTGTFAGVAAATPPGIPSGSTAKTDLAALTVAPNGSMAGYSRDLFPHWIQQGNNCDTREVVLKRDGTNVVTNSSCTATSGTWVSPYDGATWTKTSDVDIDHIVPLGDAWVSGAAAWTTPQRQAYANDLTDPQLVAVTDNVNESKGDKSPDAWKPPLASYWCTYAEMWVAVKHKFSLTITTAEKSALTDMLGSC